jgi:hypothetical protein
MKVIIMKHLPFALAAAALTLVSSFAMAEETQSTVTTVNGKTVYTTPPVRIVGKPQRPTAAVEVSKARMKLGATTPTLTGIGQIHDAAKKDPF